MPAVSSCVSQFNRWQIVSGEVQLAQTSASAVELRPSISDKSAPQRLPARNQNKKEVVSGSGSKTVNLVKDINVDTLREAVSAMTQYPGSGR